MQDTEFPYVSTGVRAKESQMFNVDYCFRPIPQRSNLPSKLQLKQRPSRSPTKTFLQAKRPKMQEDEEEEDDEEEGGDIVLIVVSRSASETVKQMIESLELFSFVFKLWRRRIGSIRNENNDKFTTLADFEQAIRNAEEATKEYKQSICKEYYKEREEICLEQKRRLEHALSIVWKEKKKARFRMTEEDLVRFQSETAYNCYLLGLELDFLDYLDEIPEEHRNHRPLCEWIEIFLQENSESLAPSSKNYLTKELLQSIGFDPLSTSIETIMTRSLHGSAQQHIETCEWAQLFITDEFKYNILLSQKISKFPFQSSITNVWVPLTNIPEEEVESNIDVSQVNVMNLVMEECTLGDLETVLSALMTQDDENIALYHGTDYESARQILFRGIYLHAGRQKRDFSSGKGFYLSDSVDDAFCWAKSTTGKPAVLTFVCNKRWFSKAKNLKLNNDEEKWREIVSSFRTGRRTAITKQTVKPFDLIEGPMAKLVRNETSGELVFEPKPSSKQMCLISDDFAKEFQQCLHSIVFFAKIS